MKKTLFCLAVIVFSAAPLWAADAAAVRVYVLKHKRVEEAALLIRPHLSESASITLTQKLNAMTVTDQTEKLDQIGKVLLAFDVAPRGFTFAIKLVRARADVPAGSIAREIGGLGAKLQSLFQFNDYALIDSVVLRGVEGGRVHYELGGEYLLSFTIRPAGEGQDLLLAPFSLGRIRRSGGGGLLSPLYRASIPVTLSQTLVVGASKEEASKSALILILLAQETPRADASEKGRAGSKAVEKRP